MLVADKHFKVNENGASLCHFAVGHRKMLPMPAGDDIWFKNSIFCYIFINLAKRKKKKADNLSEG